MMFLIFVFFVVVVVVVFFFLGGGGGRRRVYSAGEILFRVKRVCYSPYLVTEKSTYQP